MAGSKGYEIYCIDTLSVQTQKMLASMCVQAPYISVNHKHKRCMQVYVCKHNILVLIIIDHATNALMHKKISDLHSKVIN